MVVSRLAARGIERIWGLIHSLAIPSVVSAQCKVQGKIINKIIPISEATVNAKIIIPFVVSS